MFKGKSALRATRFAQTIPARRLTTSLRPQDFQRIPPKSHLPAVPFPRKYTQAVRSASCVFPDGSVIALNRLKRTTGAAWRLSTAKVFRPRRTSGSYIFTGFRLEKSRKQPYFEKDSAGMEDGDGRLRKGISETRSSGYGCWGRRRDLSEQSELLSVCPCF